MLVLALATLLFRRFLKEYENPDLVLLELQNVPLKTKEDVDRLCNSAQFGELFKAFERFKKSAETGDLGRTAQFWAMYIQIYHIVDRAVRERHRSLHLHDDTDD